MVCHMRHRIRDSLEFLFKIKKGLAEVGKLVHIIKNNIIYLHYMFTELYLSTTNPELSLSELVRRYSGPIFLSAIFHTVVYTVFINIVWFIFTGTLLSPQINQRLCLFLITVMVFGYLARFYHVKEIYHAYRQNKVLTRTHLDKLYIGWIFIG